MTTQPPSNQSVDPTDISTALTGKPQRQDSAELIIRDLQNRVKALENFISSPLVWLPLPYNTANGWGDYTPAPGVFELGQYAVDALGFVHIRGLCQKTGAAYAYNSVASTIATLPVGARPAKQVVGTAYGVDSASNALINRTDIQPNGAIIIISSAVTATGTANNGVQGFLALSTLPLFQKV
jgi:hypothetical protein